MRKKRIVRLAATAILLLQIIWGVGLCSAVTWGAEQIDPGKIAGVGNQNSYSGGGSSSGGSSYGGSSGRASRSYSSGTYTRYVRGGGSGGVGAILGILVVLGVVVFVVVRTVNQSKHGSTSVNRSPQPPERRPIVSPVVAIREIDPAFSEERFLAWAREVFITLNQAWTKRDWSIIRPFESDALFREHSQQLQEYIDNGTVNILERVAVKDSFVSKFHTDNEFEYIEVKMQTMMIDYVKKIDTGEIIAGDTTTLWQMMHTLTFMRTKGAKTSEGEDSLKVTNCPNCGAPTQITSAGECPYCRSVITTGEYNWVLCRFTGRNL